MFSDDAAKRCSEFFSSSNVRLVMGEESTGVIFIFLNCSRSQYLTVLSVEPFAKARF